MTPSKLFQIFLFVLLVTLSTSFKLSGRNSESSNCRDCAIDNNLCHYIRNQMILEGWSTSPCVGEWTSTRYMYCFWIKFHRFLPGINRCQPVRRRHLILLRKQQKDPLLSVKDPYLQSKRKCINHIKESEELRQTK